MGDDPLARNVVGSRGRRVCGRRSVGQRSARIAVVSASAAAVCAMLLPVQASAQSVVWSRQWGGPMAYEAGWGVGTAATGDLYVGGYTRSFGASPGFRDLLLLKYDAAGSMQWTRTWGGPYDDYGYDLSVGPLGTCALVGRSDSFSEGYDALVITYAADGSLQWARTWGGIGSDFATAVAHDAEGSIYVAGMTDGFGVGSVDIFLLKYDAFGTLQWARTWGGVGLDWSNAGLAYGPDIAVDAEANAYVTAGSYSFGSDPSVTEDALVLKYDASGALQWARTWGSPESFEEGEGIAVDPAGNVYVAGIRNSYSGYFGTTEGDDPFVLSLTPDGELRWSRQIDLGSLETLSTIGVDEAGGVYAGGLSFGFQFDALLVKLDGSGSTEWVRTWGGNGTEIAYGSALSGLRYYVTGYDSSTDPAVLASPPFTVTDLDFIHPEPAGGAETVPLGFEMVPAGVETSPMGEEAGSSSVDVFLMALE